MRVVAEVDEPIVKNGTRGRYVAYPEMTTCAAHAKRVR
jgi:hypothetical protein